MSELSELTIKEAQQRLAGAERRSERAAAVARTVMNDPAAPAAELGSAMREAHQASLAVIAASKEMNSAVRRMISGEKGALIALVVVTLGFFLA